MPMDLTTAITYVKARCGATIYPTLADSDVQDCLNDSIRYSTWLPSTPYTYGQVIIPTVKNGHKYRCIVAGTTGITEPIWLSYLDFVNISTTGYDYSIDYLRQKNSDLVLNDGTATWQENGPDYIETFDLRKAIHDCWMKKVAKVSADHDFATDLQSFKRNQVYQNCIDQAAKWSPQRIT